MMTMRQKYRYAWFVVLLFIFIGGIAGWMLFTWPPVQSLGVLKMTTTALNNFIAAENAYRGPNGITPMVAGQNAVDFSGIVAAGGTETFTSGYDAVVLDGPRSEYDIQVDNTGKTTITDTVSNQTITVTGESYLVFNGSNLAASTVITSGAPIYPSDAYFVLNAANAQVAELYAAVFQRQPDMGGLEYWLGVIANGASLHDVAQFFLNVAASTPALQATFGGNPATMTPEQYVNALYENVLGRAPDTQGMAYWTNLLTSGTADKAGELVFFTQVAATTAAVNAMAGANPGADTGWLINYGLTGGLADVGQQETATTVLNEEASSNYLNTSLINSSTISTAMNAPANANGIAIHAAPLGTDVYTSPNTPATTLVLSAQVTIADLANDNNTVITAQSGGDTILVGGSNTIIQLHGTSNVVNFSLEYPAYTGLGTSVPAASNNYVLGYVPGSDTLWAGMLYNNHLNDHMPIQILSPTSATPVNGAALDFTANTYVLEVGNVGTGTAAEVAAATNAVYLVADKNGNDALKGAAGYGENLVILGQAGSNTVVYQFGTMTYTNNHFTGAPLTTPDTNGNHLVDANEIQLVATLIGVQATSLTVHDFQ